MKTVKCLVFALLALLTLAPPSQAQTNRPSGTVVSWGAAVLSYVAPGARFAAIAAGDWHTVALKNDGSVVVWGGDPITGQTDWMRQAGFIPPGEGEGRQPVKPR